MKRYEAIGVIEAQYFAVAMEILDHVSKSADVEFLSSQNNLGGMLVTLVVGGGVSDVNVAVEAAKQLCKDKPNNPLKMALTITNPHPEILKYVGAEETKKPTKPKTIKQAKPKDLPEEDINHE